MVIYAIYNEYTKKWYTEDHKNPKGYTWSDFESAKYWRTEAGRSKAWSRRRQLLEEQGFQKLDVKKFELREIKDI